MYYLPALVAMIIVGMVAAERQHKAAPYILWAAVVFIMSVLLRSLDFAFCDEVVIDGREVGTHFMWHLLNAVVIFLLLRATLEAGFKEVLATESEPAPVPPLVQAVAATDGPKESPEMASAGEAAAIEAARAELGPEPEAKDESEPEAAAEREKEPDSDKASEPEAKDKP
jgi:hypothetical protein